MIHMDAKVVGIGTSLVLMAIFAAVVITPRETFTQAQKPSEIHRPLTALESKGRALYMSYGCQYCHSQYIRQGDWGLGAERIAQAGDYADQHAPQLGSNRNGPDLSHAGGEHPDDWHAAHFYNPRWTRPESFMPPFSYWSEGELKAVMAYVQSLGGKLADDRVARQWHWRIQAFAAYETSVDENVRWLHAVVPKGWLEVPNPYPITEASFLRGEVIYQRHCLGCHGPVGDGQGPASAFLYPPAFNFTTLKRHGLEGGATGGMLYYQIMNGVTGTAMPYFKRELESEKIWDVSNYVARQFIGLEDANAEPKGIDAAFEPLEAPLPGLPSVFEGGAPIEGATLEEALKAAAAVAPEPAAEASPAPAARPAPTRARRPARSPAEVRRAIEAIDDEAGDASKLSGGVAVDDTEPAAEVEADSGASSGGATGTTKGWVPGAAAEGESTDESAAVGEE